LRSGGSRKTEITPGDAALRNASVTRALAVAAFRFAMSARTASVSR
jgi:hypothetical protein